MADKIFGVTGLDPIPLKLVQTPVVTPDFNAKAQPVQIAGLGTAFAANKAAAQVDSTAVDVATLKNDFNALLAKLRAAGLMAP